jgi:hypothetical protein
MSPDQNHEGNQGKNGEGIFSISLEEHINAKKDNIIGGSLIVIYHIHAITVITLLLKRF